LPILSQIFDDEKSLGKLENFASKNGAKHYNLKTNAKKIKLMKTKKPLCFKKYLYVNKQKIVLFEPSFPIYWKVKAFFLI